MSNDEPTFAHYARLIFVGRLCQPRKLSGFTEQNRGAASDMGGQVDRPSERVKRPTKPAIHSALVGLPVSTNSLSRSTCSRSIASTAGAIFSNPPSMNPPTLYES